MRLKQGCKLWWLALLAVAADRITKAAAQAGGPARDWIPGVLRFHRVSNAGMAFSLLSGHYWLLTIITGLVLLGVAAYLLAKPDEHPALRAGLWLILGGGLGNLYDRVFYGRVIDYIELRFVRFAIFNVADICICVGAGLVLLGAALQERKRKGQTDGA